jgi:wyosine [tRNA(Phe)-imidazoG37] synthetase (radical SAM superfamily)
MPKAMSQDLAEKVTEVIGRMGQGVVDSITIGYNGEPTLNEDMGAFLDILRDDLERCGINNPKLTVFTNSSTLEHQSVKDSYRNLDMLLAKLDAPDQDSFETINRPHRSVPRLDDIVESLISTREALEDLGKRLVLQTLLVSPHLKCDMATAELFGNILNRIKPHSVQLYSFSRVPAEPGVRPWTTADIGIFRDMLMNYVEQEGSVLRVF